VSVRVLVVEDEFLIGLDIAGQLADAGFEVLGPVPSVAKALELVAQPGCDVAVLDVNLGGATCEPVAEKLRACGKPFVVLTGYSPHNLAPSFNDATILTKPPCIDDLLAAVRRCVDVSLMLSAMAAELQASHATLERKVEERTHQLELANLAKTRFIAAASHDLRQPLHALGLLIGQLDLGTNRADRRQIIARVGTAVSNLNELVNALLDISKLDTGAVNPDIRSFPIEPMLRNIETLSLATAREKSLRLRVPISDVWVRSDCVLLERILLNLVSNAIRYTERGGIIVGCRRRGDSVRIEVRDTGIGIPADQQEKIFGEFYRVGGIEAGGAGLGLGLAIVDRLCRLLKHPLELASICGKGSRFSLTVPLAPAQSEPSAASDSLLDLARPFADRFVVIIDDDKLVLDGVGGLLRGWGCHVSAFTSAAAAKASLMERCRVPDLIICDHHLTKGETGAKVIPDLRRTLNAPIPALLITGDISPERKQEAEMGGYELLQKPAPPMTLLAKLQLVWMQRAAIEMPTNSHRKASNS
jgi:signal transduction histidine kinase